MEKDVVAKTIRIYEKIADEYYKKHSNIDVVIEAIKFFIKHLNGKKILDIGCGPGSAAKYFSEHNLDVTGIDLTSNFIKIASKDVPSAKFIQMDMRHLNFSDSSFDGIWACASFLHIPKKDAKGTMLGFRRVLKPGGLLYVLVKEGTGEKFVGKHVSRKRFFAFYTGEELKKLVESCGFKIIKSHSETNKENIRWISVFATKE
jgi:ubiquinone/menaquinone biosynthesis C-methylase UbiE